MAVAHHARGFPPGHRVAAPEREWSRFAPVRICAAVCLTFSLLHLPAQGSRPSDYDVKAAYIYNFGKFVKWPSASAANQGGAFSICVLGDDPFGSVLQSELAGKTLGGQPVRVKQVSKPQDATSCRVLFIEGTEERHLKEILDALGRASVLTVSDISDFSRRGGMIEFVMVGDRVRFAINRATAEDAGLVLDSELLKVATEVWENGRRGGP